MFTKVFYHVKALQLYNMAVIAEGVFVLGWGLKAEQKGLHTKFP